MGEFKPIVLLDSNTVLVAGQSVQSASGFAIDCLGYDEIRGVISSDQNGTLTIQQAQNGGDVGVPPAVPQNVISNALAYVAPNMVQVVFGGPPAVPLRIDGRWVFVDYTNGGVAQTRFRIVIWAVQIGS